MRSIVKAQKDFWTGLLFVGFAVAFLWIGQRYQFGSSSRMGPGYFPIVLGTLLLSVGLIVLVKSLVADGPKVDRIVLKPVLLVLIANVAFGLLLGPFGLAFALAALMILSAVASRFFRFEVWATLGMIATIVACALLFTKGLGVPMPIFGTLFAGILPPALTE
jgi:Tripartite tricarboxylate transporter TctB family